MRLIKRFFFLLSVATAFVVINFSLAYATTLAPAKNFDLNKIENVLPLEVNAKKLFDKSTKPFTVDSTLIYKNFHVYWFWDRKERALSLILKSESDPQKIFLYPLRTLSKDLIPQNYGFNDRSLHGQWFFSYPEKNSKLPAALSFFENLFLENEKLIYFEIAKDKNSSSYSRLHVIDIENEIPILKTEIKIDLSQISGFKVKTYTEVSKLADAGIYEDQKGFYWFTNNPPCSGFNNRNLNFHRFKDGQNGRMELIGFKELVNLNPYPSFFYIEKIGKNYMAKTQKDNSCRYDESLNDLLIKTRLQNINQLTKYIDQYNELNSYQQVLYSEKTPCCVSVLDRYYPVLRENGDIYLEAYKEYIDFVENEKTNLNELTGIVSYPPYEYFIQNVQW